jgi:osmotically-inducible protein OsmY
MKKIIKLFFFIMSATMLATTLTFAAAVETPTPASKPLPSLETTNNIDVVLSERAQDKLTKVSALKGQNISAASHHGIIQLEGTVETKAQEKIAIETVRKVKGIKGVTSRLTIKFKTKQQTT